MLVENSLSSIEALIKELFDANEAVKAKFQEHLSNEILQFSEAIVPAFKRFPNFAETCDHSLQTELVRAFVHGVLDDMVISVKLLLMGKLGPSGNSFRQAMEGICMSAMCAHDASLSIGEKEQTYWKLIVEDNGSATGSLAVRQFMKNWDRLDLNLVGAEQLKDALEVHHGHSHAGRLALANRMDLSAGGNFYVGGHFDHAKLEGYSLELKQRINGAKWAVELIDGLWPKIKNLIVSTPATPRAKQI